MRLFGALVAMGALWWVAFENGDRIPLLTWVNRGTHEIGHLVTYAASDVANAMAGSIAQVAVPAALALYFLLRGDWLGTGLCLAWGATSALEVAEYVLDAPTRKLELELMAERHDWGYILGPDGFAARGRAEPLAATIRDGAWVALIAGVAFSLLSPLREPRRQAEADRDASTSRTTPASSA